MWNVNVRPYGEYFAKAQAVTTVAAQGNQAAANPCRLENAQGGTGIRVAAPVEGGLNLAAGATVTLSVEHGESATGGFSLLGTAVFSAGAAAVSFGGDETVTEFLLPTVAKPYIRVKIQASAAPAGSVDIFPFYLSRPGMAGATSSTRSRKG